MKTLMKIILLSLITIPVFAQKQVIDGIEIVDDQRWKGTIVIRGDVVIAQSGRLTIEPGTKLLFEPNMDLKKDGTDKTKSGIVVRGTLIAKGTLLQKIIFTSAAESKRMADWYGIEFLHIKSQSIINYCIIEYAFNGILIKNSEIQVGNSIIRYNFNAGILAETKAKPKIISNSITENDYAGIICRIGAEPILTNNLITLNRFGVVILDVAKPNLGSLNKDNNYNPGKNKILGNEEYNIYNHSNSDILAENNAWGAKNNVNIAATNYDKNNDGKYGSIDFIPFMSKYNLTEYDYLLRGITAKKKTTETRVSIAPIEASLPAEEEVSFKDKSDKKIETPVLTKKSEEVKGLASDKKIAQTEIKASIEPKKAPGIVTAKEESQEQGIKLAHDEKSPVTKKDEQESILAAMEPMESINEDIHAEEVIEVAEQIIDENQVYFEFFLDGGQKTVLRRVQPQIKGIVRSLLQPADIRILVIVGKDGSVESAEVLKSINKVLDNAALEAAKQFKYKPGLKNGKPVRFRTNELFRFK
jgi:TonB family protein